MNNLSMSEIQKMANEACKIAREAVDANKMSTYEAVPVLAAHIFNVIYQESQKAQIRV